jgi:hypothetical protein
VEITAWREAMQQKQVAVFKRIGAMVRLSYRDVAEEPLPERWVALINYLNERERNALTLPLPTKPAKVREEF